MACLCSGTRASESAAELTGPAATSASRWRLSAIGDSSLGVLPSSLFSHSSSSLGLEGGSHMRSTRKSAASCRNHVGRTPLCPPSKTRRTLSPAHALWRSCVWCGSTKVSSEATPKKAGHCALGAQLIGISSSGSKAPRVMTSLRIISNAQLRTKGGTGNLPRFTSSSATVRRSRKAESRMQAASSWSSAARRIEVVAPMDRPQSPTEETLSRLRRCLRTVERSFSSWCPSEMNSPSDLPEPERSMQKTVKPRGSSTGRASKASRRDEQLPWR
mmetsp:Transcript_5638/g.16625  ORF Transcript_5638/g.16625 Transcript_5638/m.16625 type:complete len:273 (-) Transcript_5638:271-1089(-)